MTAAELPAVGTIAAQVHAAYPEDDAVFAERLALHGGGCFVLGGDDGVAGYLISHPWRLAQPPALNTLLGRLPAPASTYYLHDLALLPQARRGGAASAILAALMRHAAQFSDNISLVAIGGTVQFWQRQGFAIVADPALDAKLRSYDAGACYMRRQLGG
jgi:GNAT superfamily N-acetyltransferase